MFSISAFVKKLISLDAIWGTRTKKVAGLYDANNLYKGNTVINGNTITIDTISSWTKPNKRIRIFKDMNPNIEDSVVVTINSVSGNVITINETLSNYTGYAVLDARLAVVTNDIEICQLDKNGCTVFNLDNKKADLDNKTTSIAKQFINHYHEDVLNQKHIVTHQLDSTGHKMYSWNQDLGQFIELGPMPICDFNGNVIYVENYNKSENDYE